MPGSAKPKFLDSFVTWSGVARRHDELGLPNELKPVVSSLPQEKGNVLPLEEQLSLIQVEKRRAKQLVERSARLRLPRKVRSAYSQYYDSWVRAESDLFAAAQNSAFSQLSELVKYGEVSQVTRERWRLWFDRYPDVSLEDLLGKENFSRFCRLLIQFDKTSRKLKTDVVYKTLFSGSRAFEIKAETERLQAAWLEQLIGYVSASKSRKGFSSQNSAPDMSFWLSLFENDMNASFSKFLGDEKFQSFCDSLFKHEIVIFGVDGKAQLSPAMSKDYFWRSAFASISNQDVFSFNKQRNVSVIAPSSNPISIPAKGTPRVAGTSSAPTSPSRNAKAHHSSEALPTADIVEGKRPVRAASASNLQKLKLLRNKSEAEVLGVEKNYSALDFSISLRSQIEDIYGAVKESEKARFFGVLDMNDVSSDFGLGLFQEICGLEFDALKRGDRQAQFLAQQLRRQFLFDSCSPTLFSVLDGLHNYELQASKRRFKRTSPDRLQQIARIEEAVRLAFEANDSQQLSDTLSALQQELPKKSALRNTLGPLISSLKDRKDAVLVLSHAVHRDAIELVIRENFSDAYALISAQDATVLAVFCERLGGVLQQNGFPHEAFLRSGFLDFLDELVRFRKLDSGVGANVEEMLFVSLRMVAAQLPESFVSCYEEVQASSLQISSSKRAAIFRSWAEKMSQDHPLAFCEECFKSPSSVVMQYLVEHELSDVQQLLLRALKSSAKTDVNLLKTLSANRRVLLEQFGIEDRDIVPIIEENLRYLMKLANSQDVDNLVAVGTFWQLVSNDNDVEALLLLDRFDSTNALNAYVDGTAQKVLGLRIEEQKIGAGLAKNDQKSIEFWRDVAASLKVFKSRLESSSARDRVLADVRQYFSRLSWDDRLIMFSSPVFASSDSQRLFQRMSDYSVPGGIFAPALGLNEQETRLSLEGVLSVVEARVAALDDSDKKATGALTSDMSRVTAQRSRLAGIYEGILLGAREDFVTDRSLAARYSAIDNFYAAKLRDFVSKLQALLRQETDNQIDLSVTIDFSVAKEAIAYLSKDQLVRFMRVLMSCEESGKVASVQRDALKQLLGEIRRYLAPPKLATSEEAFVRYVDFRRRFFGKPAQQQFDQYVDEHSEDPARYAKASNVVLKKVFADVLVDLSQSKIPSELDGLSAKEIGAYLGEIAAITDAANTRTHEKSLRPVSDAAVFYLNNAARAIQAHDHNGFVLATEWFFINHEVVQALGTAEQKEVLRYQASLLFAAYLRAATTNYEEGQSETVFAGIEDALIAACDHSKLVEKVSELSEIRRRPDILAWQRECRAAVDVEGLLQLAVQRYFFEVESSVPAAQRSNEFNEAFAGLVREANGSLTFDTRRAIETITHFHEQLVVLGKQHGILITPERKNIVVMLLNKVDTVKSSELQEHEKQDRFNEIVVLLDYLLTASNADDPKLTDHFAALKDKVSKLRSSDELRAHMLADIRLMLKVADSADARGFKVIKALYESGLLEALENRSDDKSLSTFVRNFVRSQVLYHELTTGVRNLLAGNYSQTGVTPIDPREPLTQLLLLPTQREVLDELGASLRASGQGERVGLAEHIEALAGLGVSAGIAEWNGALVVPHIPTDNTQSINRGINGIVAFYQFLLIQNEAVKLKAAIEAKSKDVDDLGKGLVILIEDAFSDANRDDFFAYYDVLAKVVYGVAFLAEEKYGSAEEKAPKWLIGDEETAEVAGEVLIFRQGGLRQLFADLGFEDAKNLAKKSSALITTGSSAVVIDDATKKAAARVLSYAGGASAIKALLPFVEALAGGKGAAITAVGVVAKLYESLFGKHRAPTSAGDTTGSIEKSLRAPRAVAGLVLHNAIGFARAPARVLQRLAADLVLSRDVLSALSAVAAIVRADGSSGKNAALLNYTISALRQTADRPGIAGSQAADSMKQFAAAAMGVSQPIVIPLRPAGVRADDNKVLVVTNSGKEAFVPLSTNPTAFGVTPQSIAASLADSKIQKAKADLAAAATTKSFDEASKLLSDAVVDLQKVMRVLGNILDTGLAISTLTAQIEQKKNNGEGARNYSGLTSDLSRFDKQLTQFKADFADLRDVAIVQLRVGAEASRGALLNLNESATKEQVQGLLSIITQLNEQANRFALEIAEPDRSYLEGLAKAINEVADLARGICSNLDKGGSFSSVVFQNPLPERPVPKAPPTTPVKPSATSKLGSDAREASKEAGDGQRVFSGGLSQLLAAAAKEAQSSAVVTSSSVPVVAKEQSNDFLSPDVSAVRKDVSEVSIGSPTKLAALGRPKAKNDDHAADDDLDLGFDLAFDADEGAKPEAVQQEVAPVVDEGAGIRKELLEAEEVLRGLDSQLSNMLRNIRRYSQDMVRSSEAKVKDAKDRCEELRKQLPESKLEKQLENASRELKDAETKLRDFQAARKRALEPGPKQGRSADPEVLAKRVADCEAACSKFVAQQLALRTQMELEVKKTDAARRGQSSHSPKK